MAIPRAFIAVALILLLAGPAAAATKTCDNTLAAKYCGAKATKFPCAVSPKPYVLCVTDDSEKITDN